MVADLLWAPRCDENPERPEIAVGTIACHVCKADCWIGKAGVAQLLRKPDTQPTCTRCLPEVTPNGVAFSVVPGSIEEYLRHRGGR